MMQAGFPVSPQASDWMIIKDRLSSQWIERQDHSHALLINGYIQNRTSVPQNPPAIQLSLLSDNHLLQTRDIIITEPPGIADINHAPYLAPAVDQVPVSAHGQRAFTLLLENVPEQANAFSIRVITH